MRVCDTILRVRRSGRGQPLLLINGIGASIEMWTPWHDAMPGRELISFDLPGSGGSPAIRRPLRMRDYAELVAGLIEQLGFERLDVLGYSLGGVVAQELAYRHTARVRRLILCATSSGIPSVPPNLLPAMLMLTPARYYSRSLAELTIPLIAGGRTAREDDALQAGLVNRLASRPSLLGYLQQLGAIVGWSNLPWLHKIGQPTLVVHGDEDPLVPVVNARLMARRMQRARLHVVARGGHLLLFDDRDAVLPVIEAFLFESDDVRSAPADASSAA
jgi:pimeloyl-ACP methyl ester carboxylesterase